MVITLAWRNIWRHPRRTLVLLGAFCVGIWSMIFLGAVTRGMEREMLSNSIRTLTGHLQIHEARYRSDPVVENSMWDASLILNTVDRNLPPGVACAPRIRVPAICSNARHTGGVTLVGIDPDAEKQVSFISGAITQGRYLNEDDTSAVIVGRALLEKYDTKIGHKLILMSQDTKKEIASRAFRIVGVFDAEMESFEKSYVFVPLRSVGTMLHMADGISEIALLLPGESEGKDLTREKAVSARLEKALNRPDLVIHTWWDLLPMVKAYLNMSDVSLYIWYIVVFTAMGFGIVNTTLMAVFERMREFGLMMALGMTPIKVVGQVMTETACLTVLGMAAGTLLGFLSVMALSTTGIDLSSLAKGAEMWGMPRILYPAIRPGDVFKANGVVLILSMVVSLYPAIKAARFSPVEAMMQT